MNFLTILYYLLFFIGLGLYSVPTSSEAIGEERNISSSQTGLSEVSVNLKASFFLSKLSVLQISEIRTREVRSIFDETRILLKLDNLKLIISEETKWLSLLYLKENHELTIDQKGLILSQEHLIFFKHPDLVDSWKVLGEYPIIRKNITNLENLSNVVSKYSLSKSQVDELAEIIAKNGSKQKLLQQLDYATKYIDNPDDLFKLARIAPIKATRNLPGTNGKIAIIGRKMDLVKVYKDELVAAGKQVEIFDGNVIPASARREMQDALASGKWLDETSEIYKANKEWVEKLINEGYEIIDVGNPLKQGESIFYNLETKIIFGN
ncbi:MAG TPA: hypothetical protein VIK89_13585 [Cytophagaceae bacterium]